VIPNRLDACRQLNESYFSVLVRSARAHETGEHRGNDRRVENEENQTQVSLRFPQPLEIAARFPHSPRAARLQQGTSAAATTLLKIMIDPSAPASVRVRAADSIFNHAAKAIEIEDIEARLSELERATEASKQSRNTK
jgi:hypothetical protein